MHTVESNKERTRKKEKYDHKNKKNQVTEEAVKQSSRKTGGEKAEKTKKI